MDIKNLSKKSLDFTIKRVAEIIGIFLICTSILFFLSLISYSPEDPNFIFTERTEINNILGFQGSYISDLFFQSIGLVSYFISFTILFTGINLIKNKNFLTIIENFFYLVLYSIFGSLFFSSFYPESFWLSTNGNGGFVGIFFKNTFLINLINLNKDISYFIIIIFIISIFLISINFSIKYLLDILKNVLLKIKKTGIKKPVSQTFIQNEDENVIENIHKPTQEDLPFSKKSNENSDIYKFKLPSINYLKSPTKTEREKNLNDDKVDEHTIEKILLDFGVEGKIKKVSRGPVVTLNEFEPAAGVKVSKIINLSEDIARNTSSESARIATIPGSSTIGIELPNSSRENVYLSEIISFKYTSSRDELGSSIPIVLLPGIVEILADSELVFLAISSDKLIIFETLTPAAGSNSFRVTTGPLLTFFIFPSTPKSKRIFSRKSGSILLFEDFSFCFLICDFNKSIDGKINFFSLGEFLIISFENGKSSCIRSLFS